MNIFDILIVVLLLIGAFMGWKNGFIKELIAIAGLMFVVSLSYILKNPISTVFYRHLPFINFDGTFKDVSSINIVIYEIIAFIIAFAVLYTGYKIIIGTTAVVDKILKATKVLGTHSKILGALFGIIESYIIVFIMLYILSLPLLSITTLNESWLANNILDNTPVLSYVVDDKLTLYDEINELKIQNTKQDDKKELDRKLLKLLVEHKVISKDNVYELVDIGKLNYELLDDEEQKEYSSDESRKNKQEIDEKKGD